MQRKVMRTLKAAVAFSMVFSLSVPAFAASDKEQVEQTLEALESQKEALQSRLSQLQASKSDTESYIASLDQELNSVYSEVASLTAQLEQTETDLAATQKKLEDAKADEQEQYDALKARIRAMYESGDTSLLSVFLQAQDISSILNASEYISKISDYDANLLTDLNETRQQIEDLESQLEKQKTQLEDLKAEEESRQEELEMVMEAKQAELSSITSDIGDAYDTMANTQEEIENNQQILAAIEYQEELDRQEALKQQQEEKASTEQASDETTAETAAQSSPSTEESTAAKETTAQDTKDQSAPDTSAAGETSETASKSDPVAETEVSSGTNTSAQDTSSSAQSAASASTSAAGVATGSLIWPCASGYISSHFGGRTSPTAGASSNHKGVDIAASTGTSIYAADGGTVVTVSYSSARGNYIVVSHGNGLSTLYQHCSAIYASVGDKVSQGDVIAAVGSTGVATGAHLHFEVWVNGVPVDPENYI